MGNSQAQIVSYGQTRAECISSLQAQLEYEWKAKLYYEEGPFERAHGLIVERERRYYIFYNEEKKYVQFFKRVTDGPCKAVIDL